MTRAEWSAALATLTRDEQLAVRRDVIAYGRAALVRMPDGSYKRISPHLDPRTAAPRGSAAEAEDRDPPTPGQQPESRLPDVDDS